MRSLLVLVLALAATAAAVAPASAAGWRCAASALDGAGLPSVSAGGLDRECASDSATLPSPLPSPLSASSVVASTSYSNGQAVAAAGANDLAVRSLPTLPVTLPAVTIPDSFGAVTVPLPSVLGLPLPSSIDVDLRPALQALVPQRSLPTLDLLNVRSAIAHASGSCENGAPKLAGASQVSGIKAGGVDVPVGQAVDQTVQLLPAGAIDPSAIDTSLVVIPDVLGVDHSVLDPIVLAALDPILDTLPDIAVPAALARVRVTPGEQTESGGVLTQHALRAEVSVLGTTIADLVVGTAAVSRANVDCSVPATPAEAALQCTRHKLVLIDVLRRGNRVLLLGAADRSLVGRKVRLVFGPRHRTVARAVVKPNGLFKTYAPLPAKSIRGTNRARYRAVLGKERSLNLKLTRRMTVTSTKVSGRRITFRGRLLGVVTNRSVVVERRTSCTRMAVVRRVRPRRDGRFVVSFRAPKGQVAPVYRLRTRLKHRPTSRTTFPTFTLPRPISVG